MNVLVEALERKIMSIVGGRNVVDLIANDAHTLLDLDGELAGIVQHQIGRRFVGQFSAGRRVGKLECVLNELEQLPEMRFALGPHVERGGGVQTLRVRTDERMGNGRVENDCLPKYINQSIYIYRNKYSFDDV